MVFQANIPQPTDQLSDSQADILGNFQALEPIIDGILSFPPQATIPVIPLGTDALYAKIPAAPFPLTTVNELFIVRQDGSTTPITPKAAASSGWTYLPSGILLKWGSGVASTMGPGSATIPYLPVNAQTPVFTSVFNVQVSMSTGGGAVDRNTFAQVINFGIASFDVWVGQRTSTTAAATSFPQVYFLAIGV